MKTIALFGITGRTGKPLQTLLLAKGYSIKALARTPKNVGLAHPALTLVQGNILNANDVEQTITGADAVISVIGQVRGDSQTTQVQTLGTQNILAAMEKHGVKRLLSLTGGAVPYHKDQPKLPDKAIRCIMNLIVKETLADAIAHAELIQKSNTDWTVIRGPRLLEKPPEGAYRVGWVGVNASTAITYGDLAQFIMDEFEQGQYLHSMPFVSR
ncbi:MAG: NAD-dependent epimerase/dehydratase family protein [Candidatus Kapaibacterium sp.]|nr:MAG: NAD-dependent epimerase/dehydratase family protein [Candidatus Kapabacteria bacterium]